MKAASGPKGIQGITYESIETQEAVKLFGNKLTCRVFLNPAAARVLASGGVSFCSSEHAGKKIADKKEIIR